MLTAATAFGILAIIALAFEMTGPAVTLGAIAYYLISQCT